MNSAFFFVSIRNECDNNGLRQYLHRGLNTLYPEDLENNNKYIIFLISFIVTKQIFFFRFSSTVLEIFCPLPLENTFVFGPNHFLSFDF